MLYVNGIALGVLELKRSTVSISEGVRQNLDNQKHIFIKSFFSAIQFVMAGNDIEGLAYGAVETKEEYFLKCKEVSADVNKSDAHVYATNLPHFPFHFTERAFSEGKFFSELLRMSKVRVISVITIWFFKKNKNWFYFDKFLNYCEIGGDYLTS